MKIKYLIYRKFNEFMHKHNWHKMDVFFIEGNVQYWCQWCGLRHTLKTDQSIEYLKRKV